MKKLTKIHIKEQKSKDIAFLLFFSIVFYIAFAESKVFEDVFNKDSKISEFMPQYVIPAVFFLSLSSWIYLYRRWKETSYVEDHINEINLRIDLRNAEMELEEIWEQINLLKENIDLCINCKKICDWEGNWLSAKEFLTERYVGDLKETTCRSCLSSKKDKIVH